MTAVITDKLIATVGSRLAENKQIRRNLPAGGRIHIDRQLPFLVLYRTPTRHSDPGTINLIKSHASYLFIPASKSLRTSLKKLVTCIVETLGNEFGRFLLLEIWSGPDEPQMNDSPTIKPSFRIMTPRKSAQTPIVDTLESQLRQVYLYRVRARVTVHQGSKPAPPGLLPLLTPTEQTTLNCQVIGLEAQPIYRNPETLEIYPLVLQSLTRKVTRAVQQTFFEFARTQTTHRPRHYQALGRRAMVKAVWQIDRQLSNISSGFDFLLQVTPNNTHAAWAEFRRKKYAQTPTMRYRPHLNDPSELKRRLWNIRIDRLEDPTLMYLFQQKREELDIQLTMLSNLNSPRFLYGGLQLYGELAPELVELARSLLDKIAPRARKPKNEQVYDAAAFATAARAELDFYRQQYPALPAEVHVRDDLFSGLMVSRGDLLIGTETQIGGSRVDALLQHEIGTHIVTYYNGRAQPFRQLYHGLAGYDELQEGLAVLAEYLVDGLSPARVRLLAARVVAAHCLVAGATFVDTYRLLNKTYGFRQRLAFTMTMRIYRGGGLIKDAIYLRGLVRLLEYLRNDGTLEPLLVGKIAEEHIPIVQELQWRGILKPALLRPRYLDAPHTADCLSQLKQGMTVFDLLERK